MKSGAFGGRATIETTLYGCGRARLDFGFCNCLDRDQFNYSQVSLNDLNIENATYSTADCRVQTKKIEFDFQDGDILRWMVHNQEVPIGPPSLSSDLIVLR